MGHGTGLEKVVITFAGSGEVAGIDVIVLQPPGDITNGVEPVGIKVKTQGT